MLFLALFYSEKNIHLLLLYHKHVIKLSGYNFGCYNRLSKYLLKEGYANNPICLCIFIKKSKIVFAIISVYVDDLNLIGTPKELTRTANYLKREFEMKDLRKTKFYLRLQIKHFPTGILVHQSAYTKKILKCFYMMKLTL